MFLLRRSVARAVAAPSKCIFSNPRSISTYRRPANFQIQQRRSILPELQRRFASDEAARDQDAFSQTAAEAPVDEDVQPVEEKSAQEAAPMADGVDALDAAVSQLPVGKSTQPPTKTLYIGNLFYEVTEDQMKRIFSRFGPIVKHNIVKDSRGLSRGFGYVEFENIADAISASESLDMQVFEGRNLVVQYLRPRGSESRPVARRGPKSSPSKTLFIGNMSFDMTDKDLNDLFRDVRNVMDVRVAVDRRTGQPRGFAHADFLDLASATKAKEVLEGKIIYGRSLRVDYSASVQSGRDRRPAFSEEKAVDDKAE